MEHFINPECYGDDLAQWLVHRPREAGVEAEEPGQEDFGWFFDFEVSEGEHCGVVSFRPKENEGSGTWILWVERSRGLLGSMFSGRHRGIAPSATLAIHEALSKGQEVSGVRWHQRAAFDQGDEDSGTSGPAES